MDLQAKFSQLGDETAWNLVRMTQEASEDAAKHVVHFDRELSKFLLIANGGSAGAVLTYLASSNAVSHGFLLIAVGVFGAGLVALGLAFLAAIKSWSCIAEGMSDAATRFMKDELSVSELVKADFARTAWSRVEHWAQRASFAAFVVGALLALAPFLCGNLN